MSQNTEYIAGQADESTLVSYMTGSDDFDRLCECADQPERAPRSPFGRLSRDATNAEYQYEDIGQDCFEMPHTLAARADDHPEFGSPSALSRESMRGSYGFQPPFLFEGAQLQGSFPFSAGSNSFESGSNEWAATEGSWLTESSSARSSLPCQASPHKKYKWKYVYMKMGLNNDPDLNSDHSQGLDNPPITCDERHDDRRPTCSRCPTAKRFRSSYELERHGRSKHGDAGDLYTCYHCDFSDTRKDKLYKHHREVHNEEDKSRVKAVLSG